MCGNARARPFLTRYTRCNVCIASAAHVHVRFRHDRLGDIQTQTLVICGAQDDFWTPEMFAETAFRLPRGKLIMYPNRGHALMLRQSSSVTS
jgi:pimeloyl-ACP methyl ester carboxylesterase